MQKTNASELMAHVNSLESFGSVDGPGVRFVIFMQGCRMRCQYCHNPETWSMDGGDTYTVDELWNKVIRYKGYWGEKGGITVSGGEPLLQIDFLIAFFKKAHEAGVNTTIDTAGNPFTTEEPFFSKFQELLQYTDLFMLDLKHIEKTQHKKITGHTNENILAMAQYLSDQGKAMWIRHVLVPGYTDDKESLTNLSDFVASLKTVQRFEVLPYHTLGIPKWENLSIPYSLLDVKPPTKEEVEQAESILKVKQYQDYLK